MARKTARRSLVSAGALALLLCTPTVSLAQTQDAPDRDFAGSGIGVYGAGSGIGVYGAGSGVGVYGAGSGLGTPGSGAPYLLLPPSWHPSYVPYRAAEPSPAETLERQWQEMERELDW